jgi:ribosomal protein L40E
MKEIFKCEICGKCYDNPQDATKCEEVHKEAEERKKKLAEEKKDRIKEIQNKFDEFVELSNKYYEDYGIRISVQDKYNFFSYPMRHWWF